MTNFKCCWDINVNSSGWKSWSKHNCGEVIYTLVFIIVPGESGGIISLWVYVLPVCACPRPAEILSHAVFRSKVCYTSLLPFAPSLPLSLSIHPISLPLWQDWLLLSDKHSFNISAEKNQVAVSYTTLSLPLSLGCDTFSFPIPDSAFILYPYFSPSFHLILFYLSVSQLCLTFPALIGRRKFYRVWWLVWRR